MIMSSPRVRATTAPPIPEAHAWAQAYRGQCGPMLDLCQAVPGYAPHPDLLAKLAEAAGDRENARYGLINGDLKLRDAYAADVATTYSGKVSPAHVTITAGCNQAFFMVMMTLISPGENVLLPSPWFWNHEMTCRMLGVEPRALPCDPDQGFVPDPAAAEQLVDARTRAIVLITPNNPTGAVYPPATIAAFHDLARRRGMWLIMDETYRDFLPDGQDRAHDLFADPDWSDHVVQLYSFSKSFCIPGQRLGAVVAAERLTPDFLKALDCLHICPQRPAQQAVAWAIPALADWRAANRREINRRAAGVQGAFQRLPDWRIDSLGAYFAYVRHPEAITAAQVAERLGRERGALCLPGSAFGDGQEQYLRIAFANADLDGIAQLPDRLAA